MPDAEMPVRIVKSQTVSLANEVVIRVSPMTIAAVLEQDIFPSDVQEVERTINMLSPRQASKIYIYIYIYVYIFF